MAAAKNILVVDDEKDIRSMIKIVLDFHGYSVVTAESEEQLMELLSADKPRLIILDMLLSGVDGCDICRRLKTDAQTASIPILMFSAHPNAEAMCGAAGADVFLAKPFEMNDLIQKVNTLMH